MAAAQEVGKDMNPLYYENSDIQYDHNDLAYCEKAENQIFNHDFRYANSTGDFPAGWQRSRESKTAAFYWEEENNQFSIKIRNRLFNRLASICQQRSYSVAVCEKQVWEVGALFKAHQQLTATIRVHLTSRSSGRVLYSCLDFLLQPGQDYYCGLLTVPADVEYAYLEVGTREIGTIWISNVVFRRVFPVDRYDSDARGRLNINAVSIVKKIMDPVRVTGDFELKRISRDIVEEVVAGPQVKASGIQDVLNLTTYSFCVLNQSDSAAMARIDLSPNGINWLESVSSNNLVAAGQMMILVPDFFLRYIRLVYWTEGNASTCLSIYFQGQG